MHIVTIGKTCNSWNSRHAVTAVLAVMLLIAPRAVRADVEDMSLAPGAPAASPPSQTEPLGLLALGVLLGGASGALRRRTPPPQVRTVTGR